ncbi:MAG: hypothetical protein M3R17_11065 [Bacteroidota bacterium]|nr:hypothetical protein [Bacteroidota bacterium]
MKNKFLNISIGITLMLFGTGFLVRSVTSANAAPSPARFMEEGTSKIGKYMMAISSGSSERLIVWDSETGASTYYEYAGSAYGKAPKWIKGEAQLPMDALGK